VSARTSPPKQTEPPSRIIRLKGDPAAELGMVSARDAKSAIERAAAECELQQWPRADETPEGAVPGAPVEGGERNASITGRFLMVGVLVLVLLIIIDQKNYDGRYTSAASDVIKRTLSRF
jgi:hypothetical protein